LYETFTTQHLVTFGVRLTSQNGSWLVRPLTMVSWIVAVKSRTPRAEVQTAEKGDCNAQELACCNCSRYFHAWLKIAPRARGVWKIGYCLGIRAYIVMPSCS
jgi:hypothetical protein